MKKAQIAMETIMIYGAAILVVTLAIGALIYFGVLDLGNLLPDKCDTGGKVTCDAFALTAADGKIQLELTNRVGKNLGALTIGIKGDADWAGTDYTCNVPLALPLSGEKIVVSCDKGPGGLATTAGAKYSGIISGSYTTKDSTLGQTFTGTIQAKFG